MPVSEAAFAALKDQVNDVRRVQAVKAATDEAIETRLSKIENSIVWLTRTILGAIVLAVLAYFLHPGGGFGH